MTEKKSSKKTKKYTIEKLPCKESSKDPECISHRASFEDSPNNQDKVMYGLRTPEEEKSLVDKISFHIKEIIKIIGDDPKREGLRRTPTRYAKALVEILSGYFSDPYAEVNGAIFNQNYSGLVVVSNIRFFSLCEHHMLPFFGSASVAYIPKDKIIGLSKIPRIIKILAGKLQVQERLTEEIGKFIEEIVQPEGVAVHVAAYHLCLAMRGAKKEDVLMETLYFSGKFNTDISLKYIFLDKTKKNETNYPFI